MAYKIEKLTEQQVVLMEQVKQEWLSRLFEERKPCDRRRAMELIHWLYDFSKLQKPLVIFVNSPVGAQIAANILNGRQVHAQVYTQVYTQVYAQVYDQVHAKVRPQVRAQVDDQVSTQVYAQVDDQVSNQVYAQVDDQVSNQVYAQVDDQVRDQVGPQVRAQVDDQVSNQVRAQVYDQVSTQVYAQVDDQVSNQVYAQVYDQVHAKVRPQVRAQKLEYYSFSSYGNIWDFGWLSFYDFFDRLGLGLIKNDNFHRFKDLIQTGVYDMIQLDKYCIVCEYPKDLFRDDRNRLHSEEQAAITWEDGYKQHYLNGIYLPEDLWKKITKKKLSFKQAMAIENMEQRMIALKYLDPEKLLRQAKAQSVDRVRGYELFAVKSIFPSTQYFLKYTCPSTGRVYISGIDPQVGRKKSAIDALKWKFYLEDEDRENLFDQES